MAVAAPAPIGMVSDVDGIYRELFGVMYNSVTATARLGEIIHWAALVKSLDLADLGLNDTVAYLPSGYFYRPHTPAPDKSQIATALETAASLGADWVLYPAVRQHDDTGALAAAGFMALPWFIEAEYRIRDGVDTDLRALLGGHRYRDLLRLARRADEAYVTTVAQGRGDLFESFDRLHQLNLAKYGHRRNHFGPDILKALLSSPLAENLCLMLRHPRRGGPAAAAVLMLVERESAEVHLLVQGIDHAHIPTGQNLYLTSIYRGISWGVAHRAGTVNLGRGAEQVKLGVGANTFHLLCNHIAPVPARIKPRASAELVRLRDAVAGRLRTACDLLRASADRRGIADLVQLPATTREPIG